MSDIDWSKAPEGATHHVFTGGLDNHHCWYRVRDGGYDFQYSDEMRGWKKGKFQSPASDRLTARPSPAWSGEGLPPVGVECLARFSMAAAGIDRISAEMKISPVWYGKKHVVYLHDGEEYTAFLDGAQFRPIRTPEQIAKDEREAAIKRACSVIESHPSYHDYNRSIDCSVALRFAVEALHDAGYRKMEQPK